jgi:undecaprenyl pyrophosphate phosphatase UppP
VSRSGAALAAARLRRFTRRDANRLSQHAALPVIAGATVLKGLRLHGRGLEPGIGVVLVSGAGASFASALVSMWLMAQVKRDRSLMPYAAYRAVLAAVILRRWCKPRGDEKDSPGRERKLHQHMRMRSIRKTRGNHRRVAQNTGDT